METPKRPIPDSYWVEPGRLLAGEYPRNRDDPSSLTKLRSLLGVGVTFFLDLTEEGEHDLKPYLPLLQEVTTSQERPVLHRRLSIPDAGTPSPPAMGRILDELDAALAQGHVVYLHCFGGIGRTATVVGCYLVRHGMGGEAALYTIARWRRHTPDGHKPAPETEMQRQMVRAWSDLC